MDNGCPLSADDAALLEIVSAADPPAWVAAAGRAAYTWLSVDTDLEILLADAAQSEMPR